MSHIVHTILSSCIHRLMDTKAILKSTTLDMEHRSTDISKGKADGIFILLRKTWNYLALISIICDKISLIIVVCVSVFTQKANNSCCILKCTLNIKIYGVLSYPLGIMVLWGGSRILS